MAQDIHESPDVEPALAETGAEAAKSLGRVAWAVPAAALVVGLLVGGGVGAAIATSDPTTSEEYVAVEEQLAEARDEVRIAQNDAAKAARTAEETIEGAEDTLMAKAAELDQREQQLVTREQAVTAVEQQIAANSIGNGIWTVGVDVEPGTYRVSEPLTGYCYWAIYRSGTSGSDIIENDGPTGGFPTVQLSAGQDFENGGCGTFVKQ